MAAPLPGAERAPRRLADFLRERRDEILLEWEASVRQMRAARNLDRPLLLDHLPQLLDDLADYVADLRSGNEHEPPDEYPRIHALERLEVGYDIAEVVAEYAALRRCISSLVLREGAPSLRSNELPRLHGALDAAIASSVLQYQEARERTLRALDRISTAALDSRDAGTFLPAALDAFLATTASVDTVSLSLADEDGMVRVHAAVGYPEPVVGKELPPGSFASRVAGSREPLFVRDASASPELRGDPLVTEATHALHGIPLDPGDGRRGAAMMGSRTSYEFSQEDQFLFRTLVHRATALLGQARLSAEVARRAAELEALVDGIPDAVVLVGERGEIERANAAALRLAEVATVQELRGAAASLAAEPLVLRRGDGPATVQSLFSRALRGEPTEAEATFRTRAGDEIFLRISAAPIASGKRIVGAVAVATDLTPRVRTERSLQEALDFRDRVLGVLSHDLRSPLSVILTSSELVRRGGPLTEAQSRGLVRSIDNAHRIERMIHDLLDYTRAGQGGGMVLEPRETELLQLCHQVIDGLQTVHPTRILRLSARGGTRGRWDVDRALQVISNLLTNALKYSDASSAIDVALVDEGPEVILSVHNQGPPIPDELRPHLFEAFRRGQQGESGRSAGLGLGLWIVQQILQAHGGAVEVESRAGEGTTFVTRWPRLLPAFTHPAASG